MVDGAAGGHHDVRRPIVPGEIVAQLAPVERSDRLRSAENRAAKRLVGKGDELEVFEDEIVRSVGDGADLLDDDVLLANELVAVEGRLGEDVGEHVERERHIGLENARVISRRLGARRRIEIAAHSLDLLGDLARRAPARAFEGHVFEEMRDAVLIPPFVAAAGIDPHAERGRLEMRHRVGHHIDAGFQGRHRNAHAAAPSCAARLVARTKRSTAD